MTNFLRNFANDEQGTAILEYSLLAAGIAVVSIAAMDTLGSAIIAKLGEVSTALLL